MFHLMKESYRNQIELIIKNFHSQKKYIPLLSDLQHDTVYGPFFLSMTADDIVDIRTIMCDYIKQFVNARPSKWARYIKRFMENEPELFRWLRDAHDDVDSEIFQTLWKKVEKEMFELENLLTSRMAGHLDGIAKTIESFYDIVYAIYPRYNQIGSL